MFLQPQGWGKLPTVAVLWIIAFVHFDYSTLLSHVLRIPAIKFPLLNILYLECFVGT